MEHGSMQEIFRILLSTEPEESRKGEELTSLGLEPTYANAIGLAVVRKASQGDVTAARFIRDTLGEKPEEGWGGVARDVRALELVRYTDAQLEELADRLTREL